MFKAKVTKENTEIEFNGTMPDICSALGNILHAVNENFSQKDPKLGHEFRVIFTKGFMDGFMFEDDREHMNHYLAEGDKREKEKPRVKVVKVDASNLSEMLNDFVGWMKERTNIFEEQEQKDNEAE